MPFFLYSQIDKDIAVQKEQDRSAISNAAKNTTLSAEDKQKLQNFIRSIEELYHLFNREYGVPAEALNTRLHNLSVFAKTKIEMGMGVNYENNTVPSELNFLGRLLNNHKSNDNLKQDYFKAGVIAGLALALSLLAVAALSVSIYAGMATILIGVCCLLMAAASGFVALYFGEKSIDTYKLEQDHQLNNIQSFFGGRNEDSVNLRNEGLLLFPEDTEDTENTDYDGEEMIL
ncbi:MAG: hypothetical protein P1U36_00600 [Legionellaceae bacterium]|nr:hypothetical protein [Legionellaceae bacterium]